ncbi:hypothetical protein MBLNU459_g7467t1 [Dothideomycetes sp. NU459]
MLGQFSRYTNYPGPSPTASLRPRPTIPIPPFPTETCAYWLEDIKHQGIAAFNPDPATYQVFRNVKDFGAKGDGVTDDTAAIQSAISSGGRCAPGSCQSTTTTPAIVYFPAGTYMISHSIIDYYYTQIIGNPNCIPTIRAFSNFTSTGLGLIDGDQYQAGGVLGFGATNIFWRQIRNFIIDMTLIPASSSVTAIHWPTAQATSLQNIVFHMADANGTQHQGVFIESGSGGFMNDLIFYGGLNGMVLGNQQFTMRNLTFFGSVTAIDQIWDWSWTYKSVNINNCSVGLNMASGGVTAQSVGSVTFIDSSINDTPVGILTAHDAGSLPPTGGSLILENVQLSNVPVAVQGPTGTALAGSTGSMTIAAWGEGHEYTPTGPINFEGPITPNNRPASLLVGSKYYERSKPQYQSYPIFAFLSARSAGAKGDGVTDDTHALQAVILAAAAQNKILFLDAGDYKVTKTVYVPRNSRIVGESYSVIFSSGSFFSNINSPQPMLKIGQVGETGTVELSDMIVSTQGAQAGAILVEYNLASPSGSPSGIWDVHARIGGFAGSDLQVAECPTTPTVATPPAPVNTNCIAAYLTMHVTKSATGLYMENVWLWTADHDVEDPALTQITVYAGRGLLIESLPGTLWLVGTAVEHHTKYQYQLVDTKDVFMGLIQTETPYYQPNPNATIPFPYVASLSDPVFNTTSAGTSPNADAWGLRIVHSQDILVYGAGLYSFFNNYSTTCSNQGNGEVCQNRIFDVEDSSNIDVYCLNTVGTTHMITRDGVDVAIYSDNLDGFVDTIALFRTN